MEAQHFPITELAQSNWPPLLHEMTDPPKKLYVRGTLPPESHKILTVVGSRAATTYGRDVVKKLLGGLKGYPVTIVSGLALGIDAIAHEAALEHGLHTVSVPGSGIDDSVIYPARHHRLATRILESGGALLSEFEPMFNATPWSFPARNRIMAGMSHAVLVVEARIKSGTLITSRLATEYNRDVLTVPGSIFSEGSAGPHILIRLGATPVTCAGDVLEALGINEIEKEATLPTLTPREEEVYRCLSEPRDRETLITLLGCSAQEANILLARMELKSLISECNGQFRRL